MKQENAVATSAAAPARSGKSAASPNGRDKRVPDWLAPVDVKGLSVAAPTCS